MPKKLLKSLFMPRFTTYALIVLAALFFTLTNYKTSIFGDVGIEELTFYMFNGTQGTNVGNYMQTAAYYVPYFLIMLFLLLIPAVDIYRDKVSFTVRFFSKKVHINLSRVIKKIRLPYAVIVAFIGLVVALQSINAFNYVLAINQKSSFIEEHYINPKTASLTAPEKPRNLIYIYLESMENTVAGNEVGGARQISLIPELEELALDPENISFSHTDKLGGAYPVYGTTWTVAALSAFSGGVPLLAPSEIDGNNMGSFNKFLPGAYTLGDRLEKEGYYQEFLIGSDAAFGGRDKLFTQHGNYEIFDYFTAKEQARIDKDYKVWWGYEDKKLFEYAKDELERISSQPEPFNFQMLTVDTHHVDGYDDKTCPQPFERQYDNVYACSSLRTAEFVSWIKEQPFYENTTVIIAGDHLGMQSEYFDEYARQKPDYQRTTYNVILNAAKEPVRTKQREFSSMDMYPTTLSALGYEIEGDKLGLGVDLFSDTETLIEKYGLEYVNTELSKGSLFYTNSILAGL